MAMTKYFCFREGFILASLEDLVPQDHLVRKLDSCMDWHFIYPLVQHLYAPHGRPSIDPVILFKMLCINILFGFNSMRRTCRECDMNLAYRWFLGIPMECKVPDYSTWSQNYIRRYGDSQIFQQIFDHILDQLQKHELLDLTTLFGDSTHQKASANKNKYEDVEVDTVRKVYEKELLEEINEDRKLHGKKPLKNTADIEYQFDEKTGEEIEVEVKEKRHIKQSKTDPESGLFHKGEKEKCFAYSHQTFCDRHGFVVGFRTVPGNVHDSVSFFDVYQDLQERYSDQIQNLVLDAGYITPAICRIVLKNGQKLYIPYKRPQTKKGFFKKYEYVYDEYYDCYICPNAKLLEYVTTNRNGYREYKSDPGDCGNCPFLGQCTCSRNHQKTVTRHLWESYKEEATELRYTPEWKEIYPKRKETIERVFADNKEMHNLRYTRLRGLMKNEHQVSLIFAFHNLKRMARWTS